MMDIAVRDTGPSIVAISPRYEVGTVKIQVVGVNHRDTPLAMREKIAIGPDLLDRAYAHRAAIRGEDGVVVLSTCNRTEIYVAGDVVLTDVLSWWEWLVDLPRAEFVDALFWLEGSPAAEHLLSVASGIDSMVIGETQILGQVKDAYQLADQRGAAGRLHRLFQYALKAGKRAHSETEVGRHALSLGHAVVELSKKVFGSVRDRSVLIIGAGTTAELVGRHLSSQQVGSLMVANRTRAHAERLAQVIGGQIVEWIDLEVAIGQADIVVSCTSAPDLLITRDMVARALKGALHKFRFFFDMAVPRDIDPGVSQLSRSIFVYDIDDVTRVVDANLNKRRREVVKVERMIQEEMVRFQEEIGAEQVGSVIRSLRDKAETIRQQELERVMNRLPHLSVEDREVVADATRLILNRFLNDAMVSMRSWGRDEQKRSYVDAIRELFQLSAEDVGVLGDGGVTMPGK